MNCKDERLRDISAWREENLRRLRVMIEVIIGYRKNNGERELVIK